MKTFTWFSQLILGLIFVLAGLNGLFVVFGLDPFMPTSPKAMEFFTLEYLLFLEKFTELILGLLLIFQWWTPLALAGLFPIIVNILFFHLFVDITLLPLAIFISALESYLLWNYREHFQGLM